MSMSVRDGGVHKAFGTREGAKQSFKDECDINVIINRFHKTGVLPAAREGVQQFMDVPALEYQDALNLMLDAQEAFDALPAKLRKECENDPGKFLDYIKDSANADAMLEYGLIDKLERKDATIKKDAEGSKPKGDDEVEKKQTESEES